MLHNYEVWAKMLNYKKSNILTSYVQGLSSSISGHLESTFSNLCLKLCPLWNKLMSILTPKSIISNVALTFLNMSELVWASVLNSGCLVTCNNKKRIIRYEITWLPKRNYQLVECHASKGQLILRCPFGVVKSPKKQQKIFQDFRPSL